MAKISYGTIMAAFVVALFSSFLMALGFLLVQSLATTRFLSNNIIGDLIVNIYILFFLAGFVFFKGSSVAAWLLYRHEAVWGYKPEFKQILPIFGIAIVMASVVFFAIYFYIQSEIPLLAILQEGAAAVRPNQ